MTTGHAHVSGCGMTTGHAHVSGCGMTTGHAHVSGVDSQKYPWTIHENNVWLVWLTINLGDVL